MPYQKYVLATGELGEGRMNLPFPPYDPTIEAVLELDDYADPATHKVALGAVVMRSASEQTSYTLANGPWDIEGFTADIMALLGSRAAIDALAQKYPLFVTYLRDMNWPFVQGTVADALASGAITTTQYASIKSAAVTRNIPITLS